MAILIVFQMALSSVSYGGVTINENNVGVSSETSVSVSPTPSYVGVDVRIDQKLQNVSNTAVLDLAKFNIKGLPYELDLMESYLKDTPEYAYGDIVDFKFLPQTVQTSTRPYTDFERQLMDEGIVRHLNNIVINGEEIDKRTSLTYHPDAKVERSYFLGTLGRVNGIIDNVLLSTRSSVANIPNADTLEYRGVRGRELINSSPYMKDVNSVVDVINNIVLIDYNNGQYNVVRADNINKPYLNYLIDINVVNPEEIKNENLLKSIRDSSTNKPKLMSRINYSGISRSEFIVNPNSNMDWDWKRQVNKIEVTGSNNVPFDNYNLVSEYDINRSHIVEYTAKKPQFMKDESLSHLDALDYIYKYLWYNEKEVTLNQLEVDTVVSLYGIELSGYTSEEVEMLKYLIAKGIINPTEDNLQGLRRPLQYKDMLKYIFRLNYEDKRFDFKSLTLTSEDLKMVDRGFMQDSIRVTRDTNQYVEEIKNEVLQTVSIREEQRGYDIVYLQAPSENFDINNFTLSSGERYDVIFDISPLRVQGRQYVYARIPRSYTGSLVLRTNTVSNGIQYKLDNWVNGMMYRHDGSTQMFVPMASTSIGDVRVAGSVIDFPLFRSRVEPEHGQIEIQVDTSRPLSYKRTPMFKDGRLNPDLDSNRFDLIDNRLIIKGVNTVPEAMAILRDIQAPPNRSSNDITFMGYSQLISNGQKVSLIRDVDMEKLGIKVIADNVLYNSKMDTYAYLDSRTDVLYYGNTIVKFLPETMMVSSVEGIDSVFYNLDVVKTVLSSAESNKSIANEVVTLLPDDKRYSIYDENGNLVDRAYMHNHTNGTDRWLNTATLSGKNSNFLFFRDLSNGGLNLYINFRSKSANLNADSEPNNPSIEHLLRGLKSERPNPHRGMNPVIQNILHYKGTFTDADYNYGVKILIEDQPTAELRQEEKQVALYKFLHFLGNEDNRDGLFKQVVSPAGFENARMPASASMDEITVTEYFNKLNEIFSEEDKSIHLSFLEYLPSNREPRPGYTPPVKLVNNNLYLRYKSFTSFNQISYSGPYSQLATLTYVYELPNNPENKLIVRDELVNYESTPAGYVPLEYFPEGVLLDGLYEKHDKIAIRTRISYGGITQTNPTPLLFDRITMVDSNNENYTFVFVPEKDLTGRNALNYVYEELKERNEIFKDAMEGSILEKELKSNQTLMAEFLGKTIHGTSNLLDNDTIQKNPWYQGISDRLSKTVTLSEFEIKRPTFSLKKGQAYVYRPTYLIPAGTVVVSPNNKMEVNINPTPRVIKGDYYDIVNQSISAIFDDATVSDIPKGESLTLPSGVRMMAIGGNEFIVLKPEELGNGLTGEEILMWRYLTHFNVKVGLNMNALNGIETIRLPRKDEYSNGLLDDLENWVSNVSSRDLVFNSGGMVRTGKFRPTPVENSVNKATSLIYPIVRLNGDTSVVNLFENSYILKDLSMSVDQGFVSYLRDGLVNINNPDIHGIEDDVDLGIIELFRIRNLHLIFSRLMSYINYILPWILIVYGFVAFSFCIVASMSAVRDGLEMLLPDWIYYKVIRLFTMFSAYPDEQIPLWTAVTKASLVMFAGTVWLMYVMNNMVI